jgi:hypothetical protein
VGRHAGGLPADRGAPACCRRPCVTSV